MSAVGVGKRIIEKVTARVFARPGVSGGGNPVTVFVCRDGGGHLAPSIQMELAKTCEWESVVAQIMPELPQLSFFMPSGEEVSFCAHAAMGAAYWVVVTTSCNNLDDDAQSSSSPRKKIFKYETSMGNECHKATIQGQEVGLHMKTKLKEQHIVDENVLLELLTHHLRLKKSDIELPSSSSYYCPTFCNSSVARPKTLVYMSSLDALHKAQSPTDARAFREGCDAIGSTGIYLYAPAANNNRSEEGGVCSSSFECRQFPRASGYPEDPATGIAAGALAASLFQKRRHNTSSPTTTTTYNMYQGTAMGRPSLIRIQDVESVEGNDEITLDCFGRIEMDQQTTMEIDDS